MAGPDRDPGDRRPPGTSPVEWITAAVGGALLAAVLAYLVYDGVTEHARLPEITVTATRVEKVDGGWAVALAVENTGGTAMAVDVRGRILRDGAVAEESTVTLDELPGRSRRQAGLLFTEDPAAGLELRALGWVEP